MDIVGCIASVAILVLLIAISAAFSAGEFAMLSMSDVRLYQLREEGNKKAAIIEKLKNKPARFLATVQVVFSAVSVIGGTLSAMFFATLIGKAIREAASIEAGSIVDTLILVGGAVVLAFVITALMTAFGVVLPKRIALKNPEETALRYCGVIRGVSAFFAPLVVLVTGLANLFLRMGGMDPTADEDTVSEEELLTLVDRGNEKGILDDDESEIIRNVFEFGDITVGKICRHRTEVDMLWASEADGWESVIHESRRTVFPVCGESVDDVIGILDARDFFRAKGATKEELLSSVVKPAFFVPETAKADLLLKQMRTTHNYFAVVLDEYGGTLGIITLHDLIEQLVGEMETEEEAAEEDEILPLEDRCWRVKGSVLIEELNEELGLTIPTDEYETFGGFVFGLYGSFPDDGTEFDVETDTISVHAEEVRDHKLEWAVLSVKTVGEDASDEDGDGEEQSRSEKKERKEKSSEK